MIVTPAMYALLSGPSVTDQIPRHLTTPFPGRLLRPLTLHGQLRSRD